MWIMGPLPHTQSAGDITAYRSCYYTRLTGIVTGHERHYHMQIAGTITMYGRLYCMQSVRILYWTCIGGVTEHGSQEPLLSTYRATVHAYRGNDCHGRVTSPYMDCQNHCPGQEALPYTVHGNHNWAHMAIFTVYGSQEALLGMGGITICRSQEPLLRIGRHYLHILWEVLPFVNCGIHHCMW